MTDTQREAFNSKVIVVPKHIDDKYRYVIPERHLREQFYSDAIEAALAQKPTISESELKWIELAFEIMGNCEKQGLLDYELTESGKNEIVSLIGKLQNLAKFPQIKEGV